MKLQEVRPRSPSCVMTGLRRGTYGNLFAQSDGDAAHVGWLDFAKDDRACWTCSGTAYLKNLRRLPTYQETA